MAPALLLALLAADPAPSPAETARAALDSALQRAASGDAAAADADFSRAFSLDPELTVPADAPAGARALADAARARAVIALRARLDETAARATAAFSSSAASPKPQPVAARVAQVDAPEPAPPPASPALLGGRLGVGLNGFYVLGESRAGPAPELSFGDNLGPFRIGAVGSVLIGNAPALTAAVRVSIFMRTTVAYLGALDAGVYYGTGNKLIAPFATAHLGGLRIRTGPVFIELHLLSISAFYLGNNTFRFAPQAGAGVVL